MKMKLPLILSTMLAALAVPSIAEDATPAEGEMAQATEAAEAAAPAPAAKKARHHKKRHGHHGRKHRHLRSKWDAPYDYVEKTTTESSGCGAETVSADSGQQLPVEEVPGQKTASWPGSAS